MSIHLFQPTPFQKISDTHCKIYWHEPFPLRRQKSATNEAKKHMGFCRVGGGTSHPIESPCFPPPWAFEGHVGLNRPPALESNQHRLLAVVPLLRWVKLQQIHERHEQMEDRERNFEQKTFNLRFFRWEEGFVLLEVFFLNIRLLHAKIPRSATFHMIWTETVISILATQK